MADASATSSPLFASLAKQYGVSTALALLPLFDSNSDTRSKATAGASLAGTGAKAAGGLTGSSALSTLGQDIGTALGIAGLGYGAYNTARPGLTPTQRAGGAIQLGATAAPAISGAVTGGIGGATSGLAAGGAGALGSFGGSELSGLAFGKSNEQSLGGAAGGGVGALAGLALGGPLGALAGGLIGAFGGGGIGSAFYNKPTTGTQYRTDVQEIFKKLGLPGFDRSNAALYNAPASGYGSYSPQAVSLAQQIGQRLAAISPSGKSNAPAYANQGQNIILSLLGNNLTTQGPGILSKLGGPVAASTGGNAVLPPSVGQRLRTLI